MRQRSVCVLGAGVTGLAMAHRLQRAGHRVVVLEASDSIAGKCGSVHVDGRAYDLGGHLCSTMYRELAALVEELGLETEDTTPHRVFDAETGESWPQSPAFFQRDSFQRYASLRTELFPRIDQPGLHHSARALAEPASEWLRRHDLTAMAESLGTGYTAAGYGYPDSDIPALYFVKFAELTGLLSSTPTLLGHAGSFTIRGGFGSLWRRVAEGLCNLRLGVRVDAIRRGGDCVRILAGGQALDVDDLVLTVPLDQVIAVLDATEEERDLASRVRYNDYYTTICTATNLPESAFSLVRQTTGTGDQAGHCVSFHHRYPGSDVVACYSYGRPDLDGPDVTSLLAGDIRRWGGRLGRVHLQKRWKFMPHFGSADIADGVFDRLEALQGRCRTYHAGSLLAFELVECNLGYVTSVVDRFFREEPMRTAAAARVSTPVEAGVPLGAEAIQDWLIEHIADELRLATSTITPHTPLGSLGAESIAVASIQGALSDWLGFRVPHTLFLDHPDIAAISAHLARSNAGRDEAAERSQDRPPSLAVTLTPPRPFFCIGGAVGAANYLLPLARALGQGQPFYGLRGPGSDGSEEPVNDVPALAARYVDEIRLIQPGGPYVIGGHSFGGVVAYEVGRQLRAAGEQVSRVVMIDAYPAVPGQAGPPWDEAAVIDELLTIRQYAFKDRNAPRRRVDQRLTPAEQREQLARFLGARGTLPVEEHIVTMMQVYQAQLEAIVRYEPPPSDLAVTLIKAEGGFPQVLKDDRHIALSLDHPANGWERVELGELEVLTVPGDHFNALVPPNLTVLADAIRSTLARIPAGPPPRQLDIESSIHINPMNPDFLADPYPFYHLLRDLAPVYWDDALNGWVLTRYADVTDVLKRSTVVRPSTASLLTRLPEDVLAGLRPFIRRMDSSLPFSNRPDHTRLRRLMSRSFTPRAMQERRELVHQTVTEVLDDFERTGGGDFMSRVAYPLPSRVIMDLVGVPRADQRALMEWATDVMMVLGQAQFGEDPVAVAEVSSAAMEELVRYLEGLIAARRARPAADMVSEQLVVGEQGDRGRWVDDEELIVNLISLINAGLETTANYLGNGVLALLRHPDQLELLRRDPSVAATAAEELLRYDSPAPIITPQLATEDMDVGGRRIKAGELIFPVLGAANRDPEQFRDPDRLDLRRPSAVIHLTFGSGIHYCIGAALGRMEGEIVFSELARRFPRMRLDESAPPPAFRPDPVLRGLESLHLRLDGSA